MLYSSLHKQPANVNLINTTLFMAMYKYRLKLGTSNLEQTHLLRIKAL